MLQELFVDFSSAVKTIIPHELMPNSASWDVPPQLVHIDILTNRTKKLSLGKSTLLLSSASEPMASPSFTPL